MIFDGLDTLVTGEVSVTRDGAGRLHVSGRRTGATDRTDAAAVVIRRKLRRLLTRATASARNLQTEADYRHWYVDHGEPLYAAGTEAKRVLGACMGDEAEEWCSIIDLLFKHTHREGWRVEDKDTNA